MKGKCYPGLLVAIEVGYPNGYAISANLARMDFLILSAQIDDYSHYDYHHIALVIIQSLGVSDWTVYSGKLCKRCRI